MNENYTLDYKGQKIEILRRDIPKIVDELEQAIKCYCLGLTDVVYLGNAKKIGRVGFWDWDGFLPSYDLRFRICQVAQALQTTIFVLTTKNGNHFFCPEIFSKEKYRQWRKIMLKIFPSDYITKDGNSVLRISSKGPENPVPRYETMYSFPSKNLWSNAHLDIYIERKIIPEDIIKTLNPNLTNTKCILCWYSTGVFR